MARGEERRLLLDAYPDCAYCAGEREANTIDHCPPKQMFVKGQRPKGLETPSCSSCNQGPKKCESLLSFFAQLIFSNLGDEEKALFDQIGRHIVSNYPDLMSALAPTTAQVRLAGRLAETHGEDFGIMDLRSPIVVQNLLLFGAKCALSLHWHERKEPLPKEGRVVVTAFSNAQALDHEIPQPIFEFLPEVKTLQQGKKTAIQKFAYSSRGTSDGESTAHWITFGESICYQLFAGTDLNLDGIDSQHIFAPGCLAAQLS